MATKWAKRHVSISVWFTPEELDKINAVIERKKEILEADGSVGVSITRGAYMKALIMNTISKEYHHG